MISMKENFISETQGVGKRVRLIPESVVHLVLPVIEV